MIQLRGVSFSYSHADAAVLKRVNLNFAPGEFSLIAGATGSGKTTLLKAINRLVPSFSPGTFLGEVVINQIDVTNQNPQKIAELVGYVPQSPDESFVAQNVIDELAFGMEQLGVAPNEMQQRIESIASRVGITHLLCREIATLSGGEKQRLAIAASLVAGQRVLLLDEPTSSLDSTVASEVLALLKELSALHGITILIAEHRLERVLKLVDSMVTVHADGSVIKGPVQAPTTTFVPVSKNTLKQETPSVEIEHLSIEFDGETVFRDLNLKLSRGSITALMGPNGSGKSSCLWAIQGSGVRSAGSVLVNGIDPASLKAKDRLALVAKVPQRATDLLFLNAVSAELYESDAASGAAAGSTAKILESLIGRIDPSLHPRDLSAGQKLALVLASQLVKDAPVLLLDEPTQGLDYVAKDHLANQLKRLAAAGKTILLASHDEEFVSLVCDQVISLGQNAN
jgi:energy-coupling factor transporter ATP-binding protein EcfA2